MLHSVVALGHEVRAGRRDAAARAAVAVDEDRLARAERLVDKRDDLLGDDLRLEWSPTACSGCAAPLLTSGPRRRRRRHSSPRSKRRADPPPRNIHVVGAATYSPRACPRHHAAHKGISKAPLRFAARAATQRRASRASNSGQPGSSSQENVR